ncbi:MAG: hypothetical protein AAFQ65_12265 [Myxococcota bacterium]
MAEFWIEEKPLLGVDGVVESLCASRWLGDSTLNGPFEASRGFAFTFRRSGIKALLGEEPALQGFVERALAPAVRSHLLGRSARWLKRAPNLFYLNVLVVPPGTSVEPHVDATLREPTGIRDLVPEMVSVAHLVTPAGGQLELARGSRPLASLETRRGRVLHFRGDLVHGVRAVDHGTRVSRLSLVCEHYRVPESVSERFLPLRIHSQRRFQNLLEPGMR